MHSLRLKGGQLTLFVIIFVAVGALLLPGGAVQAQSACESNGTGGGDWDNPATWTSCGGGDCGGCGFYDGLVSGGAGNGLGA